MTCFPDPALSTARPAITHVALSSFELSALRLIDFDPEASGAVRQGARINIIDSDDSDTPRHIVPLAHFSEAAWRSVAATMPDLVPPVGIVPLDQIFAGRSVPPSEFPLDFVRDASCPPSVEGRRADEQTPAVAE